MNRNYTALHHLKRIFPKIVSVFLLSTFVFVSFFDLAQSAAGVPRIISYQGRLTNASGDLQGGSAGTTFYFKFSLHTASSGGSQLWPANSATPCTHSLTVTSGVFNAGIGDTSECSDILDFDFTQNDSVYLQVQVSSNGSSFETLTPRQRIDSSAYAITASTLISTSTQSRLGTTTSIGSSLLTVEATSTNSMLVSLRSFLNQVTDIFQIQDSSGTDIFTVSGGGNIGIATSTPSQLFSVQGNSLISGNLSVANLIATGTTKFNGVTYTWPGSQSASTCLSTDGAGALSWATCGSSAGFTDDGTTVRLTTLTDNVGIGTSTPDSRSVLTVGATSTTANLLTLKMVQNQTGNPFVITNFASSTLSYFNPQGYLGIATSSSIGTYALNVGGNTYLDSNIITYSSSTAATLTFSYQKSATSTIPQLVNAYSIATSTTATPIFSIDGLNGRVGIGTTEPSDPLDVIGAIRSRTGIFILRRDLTDFSTRRNWALVSEAEVIGDFVIRESTSNTADPQIGTTRFSILSGGNVGIGTTSPGSILSMQSVGNFMSGTSTLYSGLTAPGFLATSSGVTISGGSINLSSGATSTFNNGIVLTGGTFKLPTDICAGFGNGGTLTTDTDGTIYCEADDGGGSGTINSGTTNRLTYYSGATTLDSANFLSIDATNKYLGIATSTGAALGVYGNILFDTTRFVIGSTTAQILTVNYLNAATTTIPLNTKYAFSFATSTTAVPLLAFSTQTNTRPTTTINSGLTIDGGAFEYDSSSGVASVDSLSTGPMAFDADAGILSWVDMPSSTTTANIVNSYSAMMDSTQVLTIYGTTTTSGNISYGQVGVGTTTPWRTFSVHGQVGLSASILSSNTGQYLCVNTTTFEVGRNNTACSLSSQRFKENIENLDYGLEDILKLRPVSFNFKQGMNIGTSTYLGFIAEEVVWVIPELVSIDKDGIPSGVDYPLLTSLLTKGIQELDINIETIASTTASSTEKSRSFAEKFFSNIFSRIKEWLADAANGIGDVFANVFRANEKICVEDQCLTKDDIKRLLEIANGGAAPTPSPTPVVLPDTTAPSDDGAEPTPEPTPSVDQTPTPVPEPTPPESTPISDAGAEPITIEEPTPTPEQSPTPTPVVSSDTTAPSDDGAEPTIIEEPTPTPTP